MAKNSALRIIRTQAPPAGKNKKTGFKNIYDGASVTKKTLRLWTPNEKTADQDMLPDLRTLRVRSRSLYSNNSLAASAINGTAENVIGSGLRLNSQVNRKILKLDEKQASEIDREIENEFALWADNIYCDSERTMNFYGLQELAFVSALLSGDYIGLLAFENKPAGMIYRLAVKSIEADRLRNPGNAIDTARLAAGIEVNKSGAPYRYYIQDETIATYTNLINTTARPVNRYARTTGRLQVLHLFKKFRPGQRRGVPFLAPVIEKIKQMDRYELAEIDAAVVASLFTVFIKSDSGQLGKGDEYQANLDNIGEGQQEENDYYMGSGAINGLAEGESIEIADPKRPNSNFDDFIKSFTTQIGAALNIPMEVLLNHFENSYSASRAALLRAWGFYKNRRAWLISNFIKPIYQEWFTEAVLMGRINAPGFLEDLRIREAYLNSTWNGPGMGQIDPVKETKAAVLRKRFNLSTGQKEAAHMDGGDYEANVIQNAREDALENELNPGRDDLDDGNVPDPSLADDPREEPENRPRRRAARAGSSRDQLSFLDPEKTIDNILKEPDQPAD